MRRDYFILHTLLLAIEADSELDRVYSISSEILIPLYSVNFHLFIAEDMGLIERMPHNFVMTSLGCDFLDCVRNEALFRSIVDRATEQGVWPTSLCCLMEICNQEQNRKYWSGHPMDDDDEDDLKGGLNESW